MAVFFLSPSSWAQKIKINIFNKGKIMAAFLEEKKFFFWTVINLEVILVFWNYLK